MFFKFTFNILFLKILFIYSEREREWEAEIQAEGEAGSMQGGQHRTRSRVSRITPQAAGSAKPLRCRGCPRFYLFETEIARVQVGRRERNRIPSWAGSQTSGLDPRSRRQMLDQLRHPGAPMLWFSIPCQGVPSCLCVCTFTRVCWHSAKARASIFVIFSLLW